MSPRLTPFTARTSPFYLHPNPWEVYAALNMPATAQGKMEATMVYL